MQLATTAVPGFQKSEFGEFWLKPDEGWKFSQQFIDFTSGLLIVSVSAEDREKWDRTDFGTFIPTKEFRIDRTKREVLSHEVWATYFNYDKTETLSNDGKYRLISQRVYEPERDSDGMKEELWDVERNEQVSSSSSIAFDEKRRENLLDRHYADRRERQEHIDRENAKPTLARLLQQEMAGLKNGTCIWEYTKGAHLYRLCFNAGKFEVWEQKRVKSWFSSSLKFVREKTFDNLDEFWAYWTQDKKWYLTYNLHEGASNLAVMVHHVVNYFNTLRKKHAFTAHEYEAINRWENAHYTQELRSSEYRQWCPLCHEETDYNARYPKYICGTCYSKEKRDANGALLAFYNSGISGGLMVAYLDKAGQTLREDKSQSECICYIDGKKMEAQEARFGGIVIQRCDE